MKKLIKSFIILSILAISSLFLLGYSMKIKDSGLDDEDKKLYGFVAREGKQLGKKYHMSQCGIGGGGYPKIWLMSLSFQRFGPPLTKEEARRLILASLDDYLIAVNKDEDIRPYLKNYPFTPKNINLSIFNYYPDKSDVYHPYIVTVAAHEGEICFYTKVPNKLKYYSEEYETYDEAVAILTKEKEKDQSKTLE